MCDGWIFCGDSLRWDLKEVDTLIFSPVRGFRKSCIFQNWRATRPMALSMWFVWSGCSPNERHVVSTWKTPTGCKLVASSFSPFTNLAPVRHTKSYRSVAATRSKSRAKSAASACMPKKATMVFANVGSGILIFSVSPQASSLSSYRPFAGMLSKGNTWYLPATSTLTSPRVRIGVY